MKPEYLIKETELPGMDLMKQGKVRDIYEFDDTLLIVATDRISAFDVVMDDLIPDKGRILTQISAFWFTATEHIIPNHLISITPGAFPQACQKHRDVLDGRSMWVRKAKPLPVECIVRGYLAGSGLKEYRQTGAICGIWLPPGLLESERLPQPIFTPSTKAERGAHDINISFDIMSEILGDDLSQRLREVSLKLYQKGIEIAEQRGIIIADTKFEFGLIGDELVLIDELLTPDSSRFWPKDQYQCGEPQMSFDKQFLRDYLEGIRWKKQPPAPKLPGEIISKTTQKYQQALKQLTANGDVEEMH